MRIMAGKALPIRRHGGVLGARRVHGVPDGLVTAQAERLRIGVEHHRMIRRVGIVAGGAVHRGGAVDEAKRVELRPR